MEVLNRCIDDAATFNDMMNKLQTPAAKPVDPAVAAWNAEVDRKKAERRERRERERAHQELKA